MPVATVFENLEAGASIDEIVEQFHVTPEQIKSVLEFAARSLDAPPPASIPVPISASSETPSFRGDSPDTTLRCG